MLKHKFFKYFTSILCGLWVGWAFAQTPLPNSIKTTNEYCPSPTTLVKKDLYWSAPGGWVSYGESFDDKITQFTKAEWIGINVGKIVCVYKGNERLAFPIALEQKRPHLSPSPTGPNWSKDLGGRKECVSDQVANCPFQLIKAQAPKDIYKDLDFFQGKSIHDNDDDL